jgi:hypothetical protein
MDLLFAKMNPSYIETLRTHKLRTLDLFNVKAGGIYSYHWALRG